MELIETAAIEARTYPNYISSRWTPQHVVRRDSLAGTFEEVNVLSGREPTGADLFAQQLLMTPEVAK